MALIIKMIGVLEITVEYTRSILILFQVVWRINLQTLSPLRPNSYIGGICSFKQLQINTTQLRQNYDSYLKTEWICRA